MTNKLKTKLPKYVSRTDFGVYRFVRNIPQDLIPTVGKRRFYRVLGADFAEGMKAYPKAVADYDALVGAYSKETPTREAILSLVKDKFGEDASLRLARGDVDDNLEGALTDFSAELDGKVSEEVAVRLYDASLPATVMSMSEVLTRYATHKDSGDANKDRLLMNRVEQTRRYLRECLGATAVDATPVEKLTRKDANRLRDYLMPKMKPNSVNRIVGQARTALNFCIKEDDLNIRNPFLGVIIKGAGASKEDRLPLTEQDISLLDGVYDAPDDISALWATLRDTGARLSEITYLEVGDVSLQDKSVAIRPNSLRGELKTSSSTRTIPLSDKALTALQALRVGKGDEEAIFTRYARPRGADGASQMLMKRLRKHITDPKKSIHSLRHSMKDALRNSGCQEELAKALLGHSDGSVASRYGSGYDLPTMREALEKTWR